MLREFECTECGHKFEEFQADEDEKVECPECGAEAERVQISLSTYGKNSSWPVR